MQNSAPTSKIPRLFVLILQYITSATDLRTHKASKITRDTYTTAIKTDKLQ
jgi:hypothetical protein